MEFAFYYTEVTWCWWGENKRKTAQEAVVVCATSYSHAAGIVEENYGDELVSIDKIEIYERGTLSTTYTSERLIESDIKTVIEPGDLWGISINFRFGMWLDNSYVKYYLSVDNTNYEYEDSLVRD